MKNKQPITQKSSRSSKRTFRKTKPVTIKELVFLEDHGKLSDETIKEIVTEMITMRYGSKA